MCGEKIDLFVPIIHEHNIERLTEIGEQLTKL